MDKLDRLYQLHQLFNHRRTPFPLSELARQMECSEKTAKRYLQQHILYFNAPLEYISRRGWQIIPGQENKWELPGLWLTEQDVQSLLLLLDILQHFSNGLLNHELQSTENKITSLLAQRGIQRKELEARIKIIPITQRTLPSRQIHHCFQALMQRKRLHICYDDFKGNISTRDVSPQRLTYYRDNWYLDAWCHNRNALRTFSLSRIQNSRPLKQDAKNIAKAQMDEHFTPGFGMFAGAATSQATLRFLPQIAHEISTQQWHPNQKGRWDDRDYLLTIPYSHPQELILDIQRHLPHVIIEEPYELRAQIIKNLKQALTQHEK